MTTSDFEAFAGDFNPANQSIRLRLQFHRSFRGDDYDFTLHFPDGHRVTLPANEMHAMLVPEMDADRVVRDVVSLVQKLANHGAGPIPRAKR